MAHATAVGSMATLARIEALHRSHMQLLRRLIRREPESFDWLKWAGVEPTDRERLATEAKKLGVPVLPLDTAADIHARVVTLQTGACQGSCRLIQAAFG
jgi:hypothetical protein